MLGLTYFKIKEPLGWSPYGYLVVMGFLSIGLVIMRIISYFVYGKRKREFLRQRKEILENGVCVSGKVIDTKTMDRIFRLDRDSSIGRTQIYHDYIVLVEFEYHGSNIQYWTPELAFDGKKLASDVVDVYIYKDQYYVDDFKIKSKYLKKWSIFWGEGNGD